MDTVKNTSDPIEEMLKAIDAQIEYHEQAVLELKKSKIGWLANQERIHHPVIKIGEPLTRKLVRNFLKIFGKDAQTVQIIDLLYKNKSSEERKRLISTLAVILKQMEKSGEIIGEKRPGVKGSFYRLKE